MASGPCSVTMILINNKVTQDYPTVPEVSLAVKSYVSPATYVESRNQKLHAYPDNQAVPESIHTSAKSQIHTSTY